MQSLESLQEKIESPAKLGVKTVLGDILSPKYSFDGFVVGKSNQFAHAAAMAVANKPNIYNPLFIAGKTGLGKTHLLKAIGLKLGQDRPDLRICYTSTQKFLEEFIQAVQKGTRHMLHEFYRNNCDVLLIDDIQFLSKSEQTQDEFFLIFNGLFDAGKQIVLSSDRLPKEIADVHDRIISRFEWGMVADIQPPELETRVAILKNKSELDGIPLDDDVAYMVASYVKSNIRELEGALTKLAGHAAIYKLPITLDLVKKVLKNYVSEKQKIITMDDIVANVAQFFGLKSSDIRGASRKGPVAKARQVVMYLARETARLSCAAIGEDLGNRHHTTVIHGHEFIKTCLRTDAILKAQVTQIENMLTST